MKTILAVGALLASTLCKSQITDISLGADSSFVLERVYVGALGVNNFSIDSVSYDGSISMRFGAAARYDITKRLSVRSFMAQDVNSGGLNPAINTFFVEYRPTESWNITIGRAPQVGAFLHRPHPVSSLGQFETFTMRSIPAAAPSVRVSRKIGKVSLLGSVARQTDGAEYHAGGVFRRWSVSGWWKDDDHHGMAVTYVAPKVKVISVVRSDLLAGTVIKTLSKSLVYYLDLGLEFPSERLVRAETGILRTFKSDKYVQGLIGLGYSVELRSLRGYLFITL
jgi:hypothetical protein